MTITIFASFEVAAFILLFTCITLLALKMLHVIRTHFASIGWHKAASVSWNG